MSATSDEPPPPDALPEGELPSSSDLNELLGEIDETLGGAEVPPPPPKPRPGWLVWSLAGAIGCAIAGALAAANEWTGMGATYSYRGIPSWAWGALNGVLVGAQGGLVCELWKRVREKRLEARSAFLIILTLPAAVLTVVFLLLDTGTSFVVDQRPLLSDPRRIPRLYWSNLVYGCALIGALLAHVGLKSLWGRLFLSWGVCALCYLPLGAFSVIVLGHLPNEDFFWRVAFPYYLAFPASWWVAARLGHDPLPVLEKSDEESVADAS